MRAKEQNQFGQLLRQTREAAGLSRETLAQRVDLDASYIYRLEIGDRRPSQGAVLAFADALGVEGEEVNKWLIAAGYAPMPLLTRVRGAVRTRGGRRRASTEAIPALGWNAAQWAKWLEAMGLQEAMIGRLLRAMESVGQKERQEVARVISSTISRAAETLEAPVRAAVIPAAGGQHRVVATHVMQRLLLRAIGEAAESGITNIILILAPGMKDFLFSPLKEALELAVAPAIKLQSAEQAKAEGLGDAILQAEEFVGQRPFAVLLPDDVVQERIGRTAYARELRRMMEASSQLDGAYLVAVASVPKTKMPQCGVAKLGAKEIPPDIHPILQLIEKPDPSHHILQSSRTYGIVGRYLLRPDIFDPLRELKKKRLRPMQLTTALEQVRQEGKGVYAFELKAARQDIGKVLDQASGLIGPSTESSSTS